MKYPIIFIVGLILVVAVLISVSSPVLTSPSASSTAEARHLDIGEIGRVKAEFFCGSTEDAYSHALKWVGRRDNPEAALTLAREGGAILAEGTPVKVLDFSVLSGTDKIRVLDRPAGSNAAQAMVGYECYTDASVIVR